MLRSVPARFFAGLVWSAAIGLALPAPAAAVDGLVVKPSPHPVAETMDRIERAVKERALVVVARVDHAAAAQKAGLTLRPTELLIFGNPKAGTPLMQAVQSIGIDLPLKVLAWEDDKGKVWLAYNDPAWLATRHRVGERTEVVRAIRAALDALTDSVLAAPR
jgi:uncharacterized protein (DUF302 family)